MAIQVDFAFGCRDRLRTACVIARKRYRAGQRLVVYCADDVRLNAFDRMLWAFDDTSFVPHVRVDDPLVAVTPVVLTTASPERARLAMGDGSAPTLLNLDGDCPPEHDAFGQIMEVVSDTPEDKLSARQRWRAYQALGHDLKAHDLASKTTQA